MEIECFVLVACPENSVIEAKVSLACFVLFHHSCHVPLASFDEERKGVRWTLTTCLPQEFLRPIVTPFELQIALQAEPDWTGRYVLDFEQLLAESKAAGEGW